MNMRSRVRLKNDELLVWLNKKKFQNLISNLKEDFLKEKIVEYGVEQYLTRMSIK